MTITLDQPGLLTYSDSRPDRPLAPGEARLKVHRVGICGTDLHAYRGRQPFFTYPRILGHELGVEVIAIGPGVANVQVGDRCSVEPYFNRTSDQAVRRGKTNCGENLSVFGVHEDGGMREFIQIPARYLHPSARLNYDQLALVETLGIGCHAVNRAALAPDDTVLIIGAGPIGLAAIQFAKIAGVRVVVMDVNEGRLAFCRERMRVDETIHAVSDGVVFEGKRGGLGDGETGRRGEGERGAGTNSPLQKAIRAAFGGDLPTVVMDATGNPESMKNTLDYVAFGGKVVFIGLYQGDFTFFDPLFHRKEITLIASRNALSRDFQQIIRQMEEGLVDTRPWISHRILAGELAEKFEMLLKPESGVIKAIVEF